MSEGTASEGIASDGIANEEIAERRMAAVAGGELVGMGSESHVPVAGDS